MAFYTRKLTRKRLEKRLEAILLTRGFLKPDWIKKHLPIAVQDQLDQLKQSDPKMIYIKYNKQTPLQKATYSNLQLKKQEATWQ